MRFLRSNWHIILFVGLTVLFFLPIISMKRLYFFGDIIASYYPWKAFAAEALRHGSIPYWNPYVSGGFPIIAQGEVGFFYPVNLILYYFFSPVTAFNLNYVFHFLLIGLGMIIYCRRLGLSRWSAFIGAIVFTFSGALVLRIQHQSIINVIAWMPLAFYLIEKYFQRGKKFYLFSISFVITLQFLAGHPQIVLYSTTAVFLYYLYRHNASLIGVSLKQRLKSNLKSIALMVAVISFGLGMAAIQILPTYELAKLSFRAEGMDPKYRGTFSFPPFFLLTYLLPQFFGWEAPDRPVSFARFGEIINYWEIIGYVGVIPIFLLTFAFFIKGIRHRRFFLTFFVFSTLLMFGKFTPVYHFISLLPGFSFFRVPGRFIMLTDFAVAVLAALAFERIEDILNQAKKYQKIVALYLALMLSLTLGTNLLLLFAGLNASWVKQVGPLLFLKLKALYSFANPAVFVPVGVALLYLAILRLFAKGKMSVYAAKVGMTFLIVLDIFVFGFKYNMPLDATELKRPASYQYMLQDKGVYRIYMYDRLKKRPQQKYRFDHISFNSLHKISAINFPTSLGIKRHQHLVVDIMEKRRDAAKLLDLLNVKYIISHKEVYRGQYKKVFQSGKERVYLNADYLPRVFIVSNVVTASSEAGAYAKITSKNFSFRRSAVVEGSKELAYEPAKMAKAKLVLEKPDYYCYKTETDKPAFLVTSEVYYPGWKAYIDGKQAQILLTNYAFRGLPVPQGRHKIEMRYTYPSLRLGGAISCLFVAGFCLIMFLSYRQKGVLIDG